MRTKKDEIAIVRSQRSWIDFSGRLTDVESKVDKIENSVKTNIFISLSTTVFLYWNSNRKIDADKADTNKRMDADKAEMNKRMDDVNKRMLIMFVVTTGVAILAALKQ